MIKLTTQIIYPEMSAAGINWLLGNPGDKIRVETTFSVETYAVSTQDDPFIINNTNGMIGTGWIQDPQGQFKDFKIGDAIILFDQSTSVNSVFTIIDKIDNANIQLNTAPGGGNNQSGPSTVISLTTPITSVKYHYNFIENAGSNSFVSPFDGSEQVYVIESKSANSIGAVAMNPNGSLTWQSGNATIQGVSIDDGTTDGVYKSIYKIIHYTKITPFLTYSELNDFIANVPHVDFEKTNCRKFISLIEAAEVYTNPNFLVSEIFDQELGNTGFYGENFNTGKTNYSISNLVYKSSGKKIDSIQFDNSETTVTFNINNTADTPFSNNNTKFVLGFFKAPADPSEYQNNNILLDQNFLFDRALQTVGAVAVNGDNYGGTYQVLKSITATFVSSSVISITCKIDMAAAVLAGFEASSLPRYFLYVATQNYNYDTANPLNDAVTLPVDMNTFTIISSDPTMIVPSNVFIRHPEADPVTEGVSLGFQSNSISLSEIPGGGQPTSICFDEDNKIYVANAGNNSVSVINATTKALIAITDVNFNLPTYLIFDSYNKRMYVSNLGNSKVVVIDTLTDTVLTSISSITNASSISYSPINKYVYVCKQGSNDVSVINTATNTVISTISCASGVTEIKYHPLSDYMYVSSVAGDCIFIIDCSTNTVINTIALVAGDDPGAMAFNSYSNEMYVLTHGISKIKIINCNTNTVESSVINNIDGFYIEYNSTDNQIISSHLTHLVIINCSDNSLYSTYELSNAIYGILFYKKGYELFVSNYNAAKVWVLDSTFDVFPEDEIVACSDFYIESAGRTGDVIKLTSVNAKIIASDGTNEFELDGFNMLLNSEPLVGYTQQFDAQIARSFHIPIRTIRKYIEIKRRTDLDTGTRKYFSSNYPFLWRWETWAKATGVDALFFDASLPNNGFNQWWFHYKTGNWNLFYKLIINATKNGIPQQYVLQNRITPNDYNSNPEWTTKNVITYDPDTLASLVVGSDTGTLGFKNTLVVATFEKSSLPIGYTVELKIDPSPGGIATARKYSSKWNWSSDTWFKSIDGSNKVVLSISGNIITAKALIDYTKLPPGTSSFKYSARIYDNVGNMLTTDDGVPIETDDGVSITID